MINILLIILLLLTIYVGGKRGIKLFISLIINFLILMISFYFIALGINSIVVALLGSFIISLIILYFVNGKNIKTTSALYSIVIVLIILAISIFIITEKTRIAGFGYESYEEINMFSYDVGINYTKITTALMLIGLIGSTTDSAIAISSALYEVYLNNKNLSVKELIKSGTNIGKDILGTTANTLLFAFLGGFMTLIIWFYTCNYSLLDIVNNKTFNAEYIQSIFSLIGCTLIIPITIVITSLKIKYNEKHPYNEE